MIDYGHKLHALRAASFFLLFLKSAPFSLPPASKNCQDEGRSIGREMHDVNLMVVPTLTETRLTGSG